MSALYGSPSHTNQSVTLQLLPFVPSQHLISLPPLELGDAHVLKPSVYRWVQSAPCVGWQIILAIESSYTVLTLCLGAGLPYLCPELKEKRIHESITIIKCWSNERCWQADIISTQWVMHWNFFDVCFVVFVCSVCGFGCLFDCFFVAFFLHSGHTENQLICAYNKLLLICNMCCKHTVSEWLF